MEIKIGTVIALWKEYLPTASAIWRVVAMTRTILEKECWWRRTISASVTWEQAIWHKRGADSCNFTMLPISSNNCNICFHPKPNSRSKYTWISVFKNKCINLWGFVFVEKCLTLQNLKAYEPARSKKTLSYIITKIFSSLSQYNDFFFFLDSESWLWKQVFLVAYSSENRFWPWKTVWYTYRNTLF